MENMETHLKSAYGFNKFRDNQKEIITDLLDKEDVFAILPTGGGKSLLYQFPATYTKKTTIVISPLISLMNDQCQYLNSKNIKCACLNSETCVDVSEYKDYQIIYATPEFITSRIKVFERVAGDIGLFAVDEAHCVSQWSHDFRESYQKLGIIKERFPQIPLLAVTATATPRVLDEMYEFLNITEACQYSLGTRRTNLEISVRPKSEFSDCTFDEPTIVYVQTRKICEKLSADLKAKGVTTAYYHGGMEKEDKERSHELFIKGEIMVIVATISFGMGIDKSDIRHVVNYGVPSDIESYYQEIGRAGRDGINSKATIYYNSQDFATVGLLISKSSEESQKKIKTEAMKKFRCYLGENNLCRQQMIDYYFETGEFSTEDKITHIPKCNMCDNCRGTKKQDAKDLSEEAKVVVRVIQANRNKTGYNLGMEKTIALVKKDNDAVFRGKSKKWMRDVIDVLASKDIVERVTVGSYGAMVIGIGKAKLSASLPLMARIEEDVTTKSKYFATVDSKLMRLTQVRDAMAKKHGVIPAMFMNDRVLMNVVDKCPKNITELWGVDGISDEFVMTYGDEFMEGLHVKPDKTLKPIKEKGVMQGEKWSKDDDIWLLENMDKGVDFIMKHFQRNKGSITSRMKHILNDNHNAHKRLKGHCGEMSFQNKVESFQRKPTPRKSTAKEEVLTHFREGKSIEEIANCRQVSKNTIENQILSIMETEDVDIDPDYFGLTEEYEDEIKEAIGRIGSERLSPIKECVNPSISYTQIKVCIMIIRIEGQ